MAKQSQKRNYNSMYFSPRTVLLASFAFAVVGVVTLASSLAAPGNKSGGGKPSKGGTGTISLAPIVVDNNGDGLPNYNDSVTFNISTTATTQPWVNLKCFQNSILVAEGWKGYFDGSLDTNRNFSLNSPKWTGGAADCTAYLTKPDLSTVLSSTTFHVNP